MANGPIVSCPNCVTAYELEDGSAEVRHQVCEGCGHTLVIVWTDTMLLVNFSEWNGEPTTERERYSSTSDATRRVDLGEPSAEELADSSSQVGLPSVAWPRSNLAPPNRLHQTHT
jgi:hypothetical protein